MAIDEAILIAYSRGDIPPTLRIYGWRPPAFSLGYFQDPKMVLNIDKCNKEKIPFVRRVTGGGIIFHDQELTYSLVCSKDDISGCDSIKDSFRTISSFLINAYKKLGLKPEFASEQNSCFSESNVTERQDFFCFASKEKYDILIQGKKLGGNAQRRRRDVVFQHGSIPLKFNVETVIPFLKERPQNLKNNICFLSGVLGREIEFVQLKNILKISFEETFSTNLQEENLTFKEEELFRELREEKYYSSEWNLYQIDNFRSVKTEKNDSFYQEACVA